jgi:stearoyl-CoA desaturase (Delta-9 desaturase)
VKPHEFDIGWVYIRALEILGLAKVRKTAPMLRLGAVRSVADGHTLDAVISNRYEVMARYARNLRRACGVEIARIKSEGSGANQAVLANLQLAKQWLHRDEDKIPHAARPHVAAAVQSSPRLAQLVAMREELRSLWTRTNVSAEQLVLDLQAWCKRAEESGITALQDFALKLRSAQPA